MHQRVSYLWNEPGAAAGYQTGVSLHGHTNHSRECLAFVADLGKEIPLIRWALERGEKQAMVGGVKIDFRRCFWTPPMSPRAAYGLESGQITEQLQLNAIVSLTDHENIHAPLRLRMLPESSEAPISVEWPLWLEGSEIHLGVHNLPEKDAGPIVAAMNECTQRRDDAGTAELLRALDAMPEVLIVLNHPMWDLRRTGRPRLLRVLTNFMQRHGYAIHAMELGGLRSWDENQRAVNFAEQWGRPVVSGGDRHGCEANACVNLTRAANFAEFADEVRQGCSRVLFMPQYAEPLVMRYIRAVNDIVGKYPDSPLGENWDERVYHPGRNGEERPISELWGKTPAYLGVVRMLFRLMETRPMQRLAQSLGQPEQPFEFTWTGKA